MEGHRSSYTTKKITMAAVMAALIFVVTWLVKIPVGIGHAYFNLGDVIIYMCAYLLGGPLAALAAAIGSGLADVAGGAVVYAVPTLIIKGLMGLVVGKVTGKQAFGRYVVACAAAGGIMVLGYGLFEFFMFGFSYMIASVPFNLLQWGIGVAAAAAIYGATRQIARYFDFRGVKG
ncbi:ECF transporter S component [Christensenellaceae bacterium OttesenSCG-928-K19]|nr:ECF transporter S component [Christensenellaceae bacterium OttesenSCG-928-K19]